MKLLYRRNSRVLYQKLGVEGVLYDESSETVHQLNETAFYIWTLCENDIGLEEIVANFRNRYDAPPGKIEPDLINTVATMVEKNLLVSTRSAK